MEDRQLKIMAQLAKKSTTEVMSGKIAVGMRLTRLRQLADAVVAFGGMNEYELSGLRLDPEDVADWGFALAKLVQSMNR